MMKKRESTTLEIEPTENTIVGDEVVEEKSNKVGYHFSYKGRIFLRVFLCAFSFVLMLILIFLSLKVNVVTKLGYTQKSNLDYTVNLKDNDYYQQKKLGKNMTYIASLINSIDVNFNYDFHTSQPINYKYSYYVVGEVKVASEDGKNVIFSKKENLLNEQSVTQNNSDNFNIDKKISIDYDKYNNMIKSFKTKYALNANSELVVTLFVTVTDLEGNTLNKVNANNSMNITIPLTQQTINIKMNYNNIDDKNTFNSKAKVVVANKTLFGLGAFFGLVGFICLISLYMFLSKTSVKKTRYQKELSKLLREFDRIIVESKNDIYVDEKQDIIEVKSFSELLDVRDNLEKPILFKEIHKGQKSEFYVKNDYEVYKFTLKAADLEKNNKKGRL